MAALGSVGGACRWTMHCVDAFRRYEVCNELAGELACGVRWREVCMSCVLRNLHKGKHVC